MHPDLAHSRSDSNTLALLSQIPFFTSLPKVELAELEAHAPSQVVPPDTILFHQGDSGETLYVILSGEIEISQTLDGPPVRLSVLRAGEYFG